MPPTGWSSSPTYSIPTGRGPFPTLLQRTCYGRQWFAGTGRWFAEGGVPGRHPGLPGSGESGGRPDFFAEASDGRATADHIAGQPWVDGRLATFGPSYTGFTQAAPASTRPPHLTAMSIGLASGERRRAWYPGGAFALHYAVPCTVIRARGVESGGRPGVGPAHPGGARPPAAAHRRRGGAWPARQLPPRRFDRHVKGVGADPGRCASSCRPTTAGASSTPGRPPVGMSGSTSGRPSPSASPATRPLRLDLWPTARRFAAGNRVRVIVAGGAHPLFARNTCSGEPLADATTLAAVDYAVHRVAVTFSEECR